jgi:peptide/nickel transport system ATP-binding protein
MDLPGPHLAAPLAPGPQPLVSIRGLRVAFRGLIALHGIDLDVMPGEALGLVGESGCGKSVTWLAALGLLPGAAFVSGSVLLAGPGTSQQDGPASRQELLGAPGSVMDRVRGGRIATIPQDPASALNPVHRIGRQITEALRLHRGLHGASARGGPAPAGPGRHS